MADTVDSIVARVETLIRSPEGARQADRFTAYLKELVKRNEQLTSQVRRLGRRARLRGGEAPEAGADFYGSVGSLRTKTISVDVRIHGRSCGYVTLGAGASRPFRPRNFKAGYPQDLGPREWDDPEVLSYLRKVAPKAFARTVEVTVESGLWKELCARERQPLLAEHQPVHLAGLPFQFPLPIVARKTVEIAKGNAGGHADVLARAFRANSRQVCLRVFEVKKPRAGDAAHALDQAVAYSAALDYLIRTHRDIYLSALGFSPRRTGVAIEAVAFVDAAQKDGVRRSADRLGRANGHFKLMGCFYRLEPVVGRAPRVVIESYNPL